VIPNPLGDLAWIRVAIAFVELAEHTLAVDENVELAATAWV